MIFEAGIVVDGKLIVNSTFKKREIYLINQTQIFAVISAIDIFFKRAFSQEIEYLPTKKYLIIFSKEKIKINNSTEDHHIFAYTITSNTKRDIEKYVRKKVKPLLKDVLEKFRETHRKSNFIELTKFQGF